MYIARHTPLDINLFGRFVCNILYKYHLISKTIKKSKDLLEVQINFQERRNFFQNLIEVFRNIYNFYSNRLLTFYYSATQENLLSKEHFLKIEKIFKDSGNTRARGQLPIISELIKNQVEFS